MKKSEIIIGISSCLLGNKVRFDGNDEYNEYLSEILSQQFKLIPVCPEIEVGMSVPREKIILKGDIKNPNLMAPESGIDWTEKMNSFAKQRVGQTDIASLSGFIFKSKSPSCGINSVKLYQDDGSFERVGTGLFAAELIKQYPELPVAEESQLVDENNREKFIIAVFEYHNCKIV